MAHRNATHPSRALTGRGFSLFELVLVIAILAAVSAIALPRLHSAANSSRLAAAERVLAAELERIIHEAFVHDRTLTLTFSDALNTISVTDDDPETGTITIDLSQEPYRVDLSDVNADGQGGSVLVFDPRTDVFPGVASFSIGAGRSKRPVAEFYATRAPDHVELDHLGLDQTVDGLKQLTDPVLDIVDIDLIGVDVGGTLDLITDPLLGGGR